MTDIKHILVTGANGQLGSSVKKLERKQSSPFQYSYIDIADLDLTNKEQVQAYFDNHPFDYIINCAAYTNVDQAEQDQEMAQAVNAEVPKILGQIAVQKSIRLIHVSTDYVFSGDSSVPYNEVSAPSPHSFYGKSKLEGETAIVNNPQTIIIRTAWLYSEYGKNFLKTMLRLGKEKKEINVVCDQIGSPTYAGDLASAILQIIQYSEQFSFLSGIYHYSNEGVCSWYDFAWEIMNRIKSPCRIIPIATEDYPLPTKRPAYSVLDKSKIKKTYKLEIPYWKESLKTALNNLLDN